MVVTFSKIAFALLTTGVSLTSVYATGWLTHDDNGRGGISPLLNEPLCWNYSYPICNHPTPLYGCLRGTMIDQEDYLDPHWVTTHYVWTCNLESSAVPCVVPKSQDCDEVSADVSLLVPDQWGYSCGGRLLTATAETFEEEGEVWLAEDGQAGGFAVEHNQDISVRLMIDGVERPSVHPRLWSGTVTFPIDYQGAYEVPVWHPVTVEYLVDYNWESGIPFRDRDGTLVPKVVQTVIFQETCGDDDVVIIEEPPEREFEVYGKWCEDVEGLVERWESADGNILYKLSAGVWGASEDYNVVEIGWQCWFAENLQEHVPVRTSSPAYRRWWIDTGFMDFMRIKTVPGTGVIFLLWSTMMSEKDTCISGRQLWQVTSLPKHSDLVLMDGTCRMKKTGKS